MSFSRARIQRFNDAPSCSPAPGTYGPKLDTKVNGPTKTKATRLLSEGDLGSEIPVPTVAAFRTPQVHRKPVKIVGKPQGKENISSMDCLLKVKDTGHDLSELESIKQKLKETVDELNKSENLRKLLKADISMKMHQNEELQHKNETLAVENEALQNKFSQCQNSVTRMVEHNRQLTNTFTLIQEKLSEKEKLCKKYQSQIQTLHLQMQRTENTPPDAIEKLKKEIDALETQNLNYELEIAEWKRKYNEMESLIVPIEEQMETYRTECKTLEAEKGEVQESMREISLQYAASLGHQNTKQKIQYMVQLKEQNMELKETVHNLKKTIEKLRKDGTNAGTNLV